MDAVVPTEGGRFSGKVMYGEQGLLLVIPSSYLFSYCFSVQSKEKFFNWLLHRLLSFERWV